MIEKNKNYIKSPQHWKDMFNKYPYFQSKDKVPIKKIKIDKTLFSFDNSVDLESVSYMIDNFSEEVWMPITVNKDYYLLDGQHRLEVAKRFGLNYIDVVIEYKDKMEYSEEKPVKSKNMTMKELINLSPK